MEIWSLVFSGISAVAAAVSAITAILAKKETRQIKNSIENSKMDLKTTNNEGTIVGINNGDIK